MLPIQDYALSEFKDWQRNPSPQTLKAFQDKRQREVHLRIDRSCSPHGFSCAAWIPSLPFSAEADSIKLTASVVSFAEITNEVDSCFRFGSPR
jgi:hypothetical protein